MQAVLPACMLPQASMCTKPTPVALCVGQDTSLLRLQAGAAPHAVLVFLRRTSPTTHVLHAPAGRIRVRRQAVFACCAARGCTRRRKACPRASSAALVSIAHRAEAPCAPPAPLERIPLHKGLLSALRAQQAQRVGGALPTAMPLGRRRRTCSPAFRRPASGFTSTIMAARAGTPSP